MTPVRAGFRVGAVANHDSLTRRVELEAAHNALNDQLNDWNDGDAAYSAALTHPEERCGISLTPRWNIRRKTCAASRAASSRTDSRVRQDER